MRILIPILALLALLPLQAAAGKVTLEMCETDKAAMLAQAEANRERSVNLLTRDLGRASDDTAATLIAEQIDRAWELEEIDRATAFNIYRSCVNYVKSGGS